MHIQIAFTLSGTFIKCKIAYVGNSTLEVDAFAVQILAILESVVTDFSDIIEKRIDSAETCTSVESMFSY